MSREYFLQLAGRGVRMPIGTDLLLHELPDPETAVLDGRRLAEVMRSAAVRYQTPLAVPLMDLRLEKADLLRMLGIAEEEADRFHFACVPGAREIAAVEAALESPFSQRIQAHLDSIRIIADEGKLFPLGMAIGPFSLTTKMLADPILAIAMAGGGTTAEESSEVAALETCLKLAELVVARSLRAQVAAGARAVIVCEPAANRVFISPRQVARGSGCWENLVMQPAMRFKEVLESGGADLIFHDCGELTNAMVEQFGKRIHPAMLSLGSSRILWEDAALAPKDVVLYGNLPTKNFYSDSVVPVEAVESMTRDLTARMREAGHPHILGSECDVLHVPGSGDTIRHKVERMLTCAV